LDVRYSALGAGWHGLALQRTALFALLHRAVMSAGIEIIAGVEIGSVEREGESIAPKNLNGRRLGSFDLVVDALGARSALAAKSVQRKVLPYGALWANVPWPQSGGFSANALEQRYFRASRMAGLLPIGSSGAGEPRLAAFFWSLRRDQFPAWRARPIAEWKRDVERLWPQTAAAIATITEHDQLVFAQYDHFTLRTPYFAISDSARRISRLQLRTLSASDKGRGKESATATPTEKRKVGNTISVAVKPFHAA